MSLAFIGGGCGGGVSFAPSAHAGRIAMSASSSAARPRINARAFFTQYSGHPARALRALAAQPREKGAIWLLGDSTLDNKYWLPWHNEAHPDALHARLLDQQLLKRDVSYWLNLLCGDFVTFNCAVEASTLAQRRAKLLQNDRVVSESFGERDVLVVSLGGNDVALSPSLRTIVSVLMQVYTESSIGFEHLVRLFGDSVREFIVRVLADRRPRLVVVCGLYFPDETQAPSWASFVLRALQYNSQPHKLQRLIQAVFEAASSRVTIPGVRVVTVPFYRSLNGRDTAHYVARVEPSEEGGYVMAELLRDVINTELDLLTNADQD